MRQTDRKLDRRNERTRAAKIDNERALKNQVIWQHAASITIKRSFWFDADVPRAEESLRLALKSALSQPFLSGHQ